MSRPRVLLLDDAEGPRMTFAALLEDEGYVVHEAATLADARSLLRTERYDLAVLDLELPDGSGTELTSELAAAKPPTVIAILSGHAPSAVSNVQLFITKADPPAAVLDRLRRALAAGVE